VQRCSFPRQNLRALGTRGSAARSQWQQDERDGVPPKLWDAHREKSVRPTSNRLMGTYAWTSREDCGRIVW